MEAVTRGSGLFGLAQTEFLLEFAHGAGVGKNPGSSVFGRAGTAGLLERWNRASTPAAGALTIPG